MRRLTVFAILVFSASMLCAGPVYRFGILYLDNAVSNQRIGPEFEGTVSPILPHLGFGWQFDFTNFIGMYPAADVYYIDWQMSYDGLRALPASTNKADAAFAPALFLDAPAYISLPTVGAFDMGVTVGPTFNLRFPLVGYGVYEGNLGDFWKGFYGGARFLGASAGFVVAVPINEGIRLSLVTRAVYPAANLWLGDGYPALQDLILDASFGIEFR